MHRIGPLLVVLVVACSTTDKPAADTGEAAGTGTGLPGTAGPGTGGSATGGTGTGGTATGSGSATGGPGTGTATGGTGTGGSATGSGTATGGSGTGTGGSGTGGTATGGSGTGGTATGSGTATGGPGTGTSGTATGSGTGTATGTATGGTGTGTGDPYRDADGDGFPGSEDCDDDDPLVFPGAEEICDGLPTACAGLPPDEIDDDRDGYVECVPEGWRGALILGGEDCDDTNPDAYPRATEVCDGVLTDCNLAGLLEIESDLDGDGFVGCTIDAGGWDGDPAVIGGDDCDDADDTVFPGAPELCDGVANACGDLPDAERDLDLDGWVACAIDPAGWRGDPVLGGGDCDDADPTRFPTAREACDGVDNACTGGLPDDEVDGDGDGFVACDVIGDWFGPPIDGGGDCDPEDGAVFPGAVEVCNGIDDDCNLLTDDRDPGLDPDTLLEWWVDLDGDGFGADGDPLLLCDLPGGVRAPGDCDDFDADRYPGAPEWCDGLLQDCDGEAEGRVATFFRDGDPPEDWTAALAGEVELVGPGTLALCDGVWGVRLALGGPSLTIEGRGDVTLDGMGDGATILNLARNLTVSGVTITGGVAGATAAGLEGGVGNTLTLTDVRFVDNEGGAVGGALHTEGGRLTVEACRFEGNTAALGGGVYTVDTVASYTDSHLERNDASDGGALRVEGGTADLVGTTITLNTAARGGGVFATSAAAVTCDGGVIASNTADEGGGARIDAATLGLVDCDMGTDPDDNAPEDVWTPVGGFDWAGLATSFCDGAGCR